MRRSILWGVLLVACSERAPRERPRADVPAVQVVASAADVPLVPVRAREPNDTWEVATPVAVGEEAHDAMAVSSDRDVFALTVDRPRAVAVSLSAVPEADLTLEISDTNGTVLALADAGPANTAEGVPNLWLEPGRYAVVVSEFVKPAARSRKTPRAGPVAPLAPAPRDLAVAAYTLAIAQAQIELDAEREPNQAIATASPLGLAERKVGFIGWRGDVDLWALATEGLGGENLIDIEIGGVPGVSLTVELLGADASAAPILARKGKPAGRMFIRGLPLPGAGAWLRISGSRSNPDTGYDVQFGARYVEPSPAIPAEVEPNDRAEQATRLGAPGLLGWLDEGDVDIFELEAQPGDVEVTLVPSDALDVALEALEGGGAGVANAGGPGASEQLRFAAGRAAKFAVRLIKRRGEATLSGAEAAYRLEWTSASPALPVLGGLAEPPP